VHRFWDCSPNYNPFSECTAEIFGLPSRGGKNLKNKKKKTL
jgi:hypothetical protein